MTTAPAPGAPAATGANKPTVPGEAEHETHRHIADTRNEAGRNPVDLPICSAIPIQRMTVNWKGWIACKEPGCGNTHPVDVKMAAPGGLVEKPSPSAFRCAQTPTG